MQKSPDSGSFLIRTVNFCRFLRESGFKIYGDNSIDIARVLRHIDFTNTLELRNGLRALLVKSAEDYEFFDSLFQMYWLEEQGEEQSSGKRRQKEDQVKAQNVNRTNARGRGTIETEREHGFGINMERNQGGDLSLVSIYSPEGSQGGTRFNYIPQEIRQKVRRRIRNFSRKMATYPGVRDISSSKGAIFMRKTMREFVTKDELARIRNKKKKLTKSRIILLVDISGSMSSQKEGAILLMHCLLNTIPRSRVFGFSTELSELTPYFRGKSIGASASLLSEEIRHWGSGTRTGEALGEILKKYWYLLNSDTNLIILSDGCDMGDSGTLSKNLELISKRTSSIVWINPLADSPNFEPRTGGLVAALPFVEAHYGFLEFIELSPDSISG